MAYPSAIPSLTDPTNGVSYVDASYVTNLNTEVEAICTELGTLPKGSHADVKTRIAAIESGYLSAGVTRRVQIQSVKGTSTPPTESTLTNTVVQTNVMWFDEASTQSVLFSFVVPPDWNGTSDITLGMAYTLQTTASNSVVMQMYYFSRASTEALTGGVTEYSDSVTLSMTGLTQNYVYTTADLTMNYSYLSDGEIVTCLLRRKHDDASDTYAYDFGIVHLWLQYTNKKQ